MGFGGQCLVAGDGYINYQLYGWFGSRQRSILFLFDGYMLLVKNYNGGGCVVGEV